MINILQRHSHESVMFLVHGNASVRCFRTIWVFLNWYGSLYVTLCFVLCRFDFDVLYVEFSVLCIMFHISNGAIHEVEPRWRRNEERKARVQVFECICGNVT